MSLDLAPALVFITHWIAEVLLRSILLITLMAMKRV